MEARKLNGCLKGCGITLLVLLGLFLMFIAIAVLIPQSAKDLYKDAERSYFDEDYTQAYKDIENSIKKDSTNPEYHLLKAKVVYKLNDTIASEKSIADALKLSVNDSLRFQITKKIIDWRTQNNDTISAKSLLLSSLNAFHIQDFENYSNSYYYVADRILSIKTPQDASDILHNFIDSISVLKKDTINYRKAHYMVSNKLLRLKDSVRALQVLKKLTKEIKNSKLAYKKIAHYYAGRSQNKTAIRYLKEYIKIDDTNSEVYKEIGDCYLDIDNKKSAVKYYRIATEKGHGEACSKLRELTARTRYYTQSRCCDGSTSSSTGRGTCSHHGGVCDIEYIPYKEYTINCK